MSYYRNRGECEYFGCRCSSHRLLEGTERCKNCNHGTCWHKKMRLTSRSQFKSTRSLARTPNYTSIR